MPYNLQLEFTSRVERFLRLRNIYFNKEEATPLINFLYAEFKKEGRFDNESGHFHLTPRFIMNALTRYLKISAEEVLPLFRSHSMKLYSPAYKGTSLGSLPITRSGRGLIDLIGRKHNPEYKLTQANGAPLTPLKSARAGKHFERHAVGFSPFASFNSSHKAPRKRATATDTSQYEQEMVSSDMDMALWRKRTPQKDRFFSPNRVRFARKPDGSDMDVRTRKIDFSFDPDSKKDSTELFQFSVTKADILSRIDAQRPVTQKRVMGNVSAMELMQAFGAVISDKQNGRNFHWAHRQGWSLCGDQSKYNLDPMTAGSNYDTLFKVEAPLKKLLFDEVVDEVQVNGEVIFDEERGLPFKITYRLSWGTNCYDIVIDPMCHRVPTVDEHEVANKFLGFRF